jgi:hypothetical protein
MTSILQHFDKTSAAGYYAYAMIIRRKSLNGAHIVRRALTGLTFIVIAATQLGCQSSIEVVTPAVTPVSPAVTTVPQAHAVAIVGVDFDPALNYSQIAANGGVTLLVAVENEGLATESNVELKVRLLDTVDAARPQELLNETVVIRSLLPHEVRVVRFDQVTDLPVREQYKLVAELSPVKGEYELSDNSRSFDILVHNGN